MKPMKIYRRKPARACYQCGAATMVYDSREDEYGRIIRKRKCPLCQSRFKTIELYVEPMKIKNEKQ